MAPSEFDLRAALREGEGAGPDADLLIAAGQTRRAQRRTRLLSAAGVIIVVGGGAFGATQLGGRDGSGGGSSVAAAHGGQPRGPMQRLALRPNAHSNEAYGSANGGAAADVTSPAQAKLADISCPSAAPDYLLPGGGGLNSYGASGRLFARPVASVVVCAYGTTFAMSDSPTPRPARLELAGPQAELLARSLELAKLKSTAASCNVVPDRFAVIGVDASGKRDASTVSAELGCGGKVTNGTAVRYEWTPPPDLARRLQALTPTAVAATPNATPTN
jgi:hypothetical protein